MSVSASSTTNVACVWGANGISGIGMIDTLIDQSYSEFSKIICISRRPMQINLTDDRIHFISIDVMEASIDDIVDELIKVDGRTITHMFHYAYISKMDETEQDHVNKVLLQKALDVTAKIAGQNVKCVSLQTGYKYYGAHKGPQHMPTQPFVEDAPRHEGVNFYYSQEDLIKEYAQKNKWNYSITRPNLIIGVSKGNFMNFAVSLAIYASVQKEKGEPLIFPGHELAWNIVLDHSSSLNNARFQLWAATNGHTANEIFNIHNGDKVQFRILWPKFEKYFGFAHHEQKFPENKMAPQLVLFEYMTQNRAVWDEVVQRHNLDQASFDYATWMFSFFLLNVPYNIEGDLSKARKYGWTTTVDTADAYIQCFDRLKQMKVIP
ncbi:unnamed protein product [Adineta ricciae]|uniref:PRISE-like Rossmann-fold domain-containing protein n=1 Tax=Adineta ricciae TaxID=249248 RepID=A0A813XE51_ADIRI|nr:unnamed protein product [Adineta ricciae]